PAPDPSPAPGPGPAPNGYVHWGASDGSPVRMIVTGGRQWGRGGASERHPAGVRRASERHPAGVRRASGGRPWGGTGRVASRVGQHQLLVALLDDADGLVGGCGPDVLVEDLHLDGAAVAGRGDHL